MAFAGFDSLAYPGDDVMAWLKSNTNLTFVGFYLAPAPSRPSSAWMPKRSTVVNQGWGLAPVYVGQQEATQPGSHDLTAEQGKIDGLDAAKLMRAAGFPDGSTVYLDCEAGGPASVAAADYIKAWGRALNSVGSFAAGIYCSHTTVPSLLQILPPLAVWTWNLVDLTPTSPQFPVKSPGDSGVMRACVWQYAQNTTIEFAGSAVPSLKLDLDCAAVPDPSKLPSGADAAIA